MFRVNETKCMFSSKEILRILDCKACEVKDFEITEVRVVFFLCPGLIFLSSMRFYRHFSNWQPGFAVK